MAGTYASLVARFAAGTLTDASTLDHLKGIGPTIFARLQTRHVRTLAELVAIVSGLSSAEIHAVLSYFTLNSRANQCVVTAGPKVDAFVALNNAPPATRVRYHVQDSNHGGYNALLDVLRYARTHPAGAFGFDYDIGALPPYQLPRSGESAYCGCQSTRSACALFGTSCEWKTGNVGGGRRGRPVTRGLCVPRSRATAGFRGRDGFRGQRNEPSKPSGGPLFVEGWRVPGPTLDPFAYPLIDYAADASENEESDDGENDGGGGGRGARAGRGVRGSARGVRGGGGGGGARRPGRQANAGRRSGRGAVPGVREGEDMAGDTKRDEIKMPLASFVATERSTPGFAALVKGGGGEMAAKAHGHNTRSRAKLFATSVSTNMCQESGTFF